MIQSPQVSGLQAEISWDGETWRVQDLNSRNGTFLDGRKLNAGERVMLYEGAKLAFGERAASHWVSSVAAPRLIAKSADGVVLYAEAELLCLPSLEDCELTIYRDGDGAWIVESEDGTRPLEEQETLIAGGRVWDVHAPVTIVDTQESSAISASIQLEFVFSRDGEHVTSTLHLGTGPIELKFRSYMLLLAVLARHRVADTQQSHLPHSEHGWVYCDDLLHEFDIDMRLLNLWIHRARRQLAKLGVLGAGQLIERRTGTKQLRIGVSQLRVRSG